MWLKTLKLQNLRPYSYAIANLSPHINLFFGLNGEGKTSILEAIHLLGTLKSFRTYKNSEIIQTGKSEASIIGDFEEPQTKLSLTWQNRGRVTMVNDTKTPDIKEFVKDLRVVALAPEHQALVIGSMEERRKYIDRILFALDPTYLNLAQNYHRAVKQKQALLKQHLPWNVFEDLVSPWNQELAIQGEKIRKLRNELILDLTQILEEMQLQVAPKNPTTKMKYTHSTPPLKDELKELMHREHLAGRTLAGPHKDQILFIFKNKPMEEVGSQGEKSTLLLSLKLAELEYIEQKIETAPILLLDDLGATLDSKRQSQLLKLLKKLKNQILVATADQRIFECASEVGAVVKVKKMGEMEGGFYVANWGVP